MSSEAFVTLATTDGYALGALVLAQSIRQVGTKRQLVVLISNHLSDLIRRTLEVTFDDVIVVEELNSNDDEHLSLLSRPELGITFTKINCWLLEQYTKCVFLDSDCLVLREIDDLFQREELSAAPDAGWPDCFNSGVFVFKPSKDTFNQLMNFASQQNASFDGGDQGLLNGYFSNWRSGDISRHLPFTYNVTANAFYSYLPAVTRFRNDIHVVHFAGALKPWNLTYNSQNEQLSGNLSGQNDIQRQFFFHGGELCIKVFGHNYQNLQSNSNKKSSIGGEGEFGDQFTSLNYGNLTYNKGIELGSVEHRRAWESGHIDYYGRDSFSNIQQQLERNIAQNQPQYHPSQQRQTTPEKPTTSILKNSNKEPSPPTNHHQTTTNISKSILKEPTQTTNVSSNLLKEAPPSHQTTNTQKTVLKETPPTQQTTNIQKPVLKEAPPSQQTINIPKPVLKEASTSHQTTSIQKTVLKEALPSQQTINIPKPLLKETTPSQQTTHLTQKTHSSNGSTLLNENKTPTVDHESNWTVKSTIVTAYTQGAGDFAEPTVISKSVSQSSASSSHDAPVVTTIKQSKDSNDLSTNKMTAKTPDDHFAWLFDKLFVGITYMISLCYLLFLVAIRRSDNTSIIHGNGTKVHGTTHPTTATSHGNRVNK